MLAGEQSSGQECPSPAQFVGRIPGHDQRAHDDYVATRRLALDRDPGAARRAARVCAGRAGSTRGTRRNRSGPARQRRVGHGSRLCCESFASFAGPSGRTSNGLHRGHGCSVSPARPTLAASRLNWSRRRQTDFDHARADAHRVVAQPADAGGCPGTRLEVGRLGFGRRARWRPRRVVTAFGIQSAGGRELDDAATARSKRPLCNGQATTHPSSVPSDSGAAMCGQRSSITHKPCASVGEQEIELADGDSSQGPRRAAPRRGATGVNGRPRVPGRQVPRVSAWPWRRRVGDHRPHRSEAKRNLTAGRLRRNNRAQRRRSS